MQHWRRTSNAPSTHPLRYLSNSTFDSNPGFLTHDPLPDDTVLYGVAIGALNQDFMRTSCVAPVLRRAFPLDGTSALLAAALLALGFESVMFIRAMLDAMDMIFAY
jgi:hypothetical protein